MGKKSVLKKLMPLALAAAMVLQAVPAMAAQNDISGHWAEKTIAEWQEKGLIKGYSDGSFKPDNSISRAEFVVIMNNAKGFNEVGEISLKDVAEDDWFYEAVAKAVTEGYTKGYEDGTFRPDNTITRAEAAVMMANVMDLEAKEDGDEFSDTEEIPSWAKNSVNAVVGAGFMKGYPDGTFKAANPITRAEAVTALNNMLAYKEDLIITEDGTVVKDKTVTGDLIIEESVGDGNVYLENVTVEGDALIKGGGSHSVYLNGSTIGGRIMMQKNGVHVHISGKSNISVIDMPLPGKITFNDDFSGSVKTITIPEGAPEGEYTIKAENKELTPVEKVNLNAKANLNIEANVSNVTVGEKAEKSTITVEENITVDNMEVSSNIEVGGKGTVDTVEVTLTGSINTPNTKPSSGSSGGGSGSSDSDREKTTVNTLAVGYLRRLGIQAIFDQKVPVKGTKVNVVAIYDNGQKVTLTSPSAAGKNDGDFTLGLDDFEDYYNSDYTSNVNNWNMLGIFFSTPAAYNDVSGFEVTVTAPGYSFSTIKINENDTLTESINMIDRFIKGSKLTTEDYLGFQVYGAEDIDVSEISATISPADSGLTIGNIDKDTEGYTDSTYIRMNYEGAPTKAGTYFATITIPASAIAVADGYTAKDVTAYCAIKVLDPQITSVAIYVAGTTTPITEADLGSDQSVDILLSGKNLLFGSISVKLANAEGEGSNVLTPTYKYYDDPTKELFDYCPLKKRTADTYYVWYSFDKENWTKLDSPTLTIVAPSAPTTTTVTVTKTDVEVNGNTDKEVKLTLDKTDLTLDTDYTVTVSKDSSTLTKDTEYTISVESGVITITFENDVIVNGAEYKVTVATKDEAQYTFTGGEVTLTNSTPESGSSSEKYPVEFKTGSPVSIASGESFKDFEGNDQTYSATVTGADIIVDKISGSWKSGRTSVDAPFSTTHSFDTAKSLNVTFSGTAPTVTEDTTYTYVITIPKDGFENVQTEYYYVPEGGMTINFIDITVTAPVPEASIEAGGEE